MFTILVAAPTGSPGIDYKHIQDAVKAVHAAGGGQVSLRPGTYVVNRAIDMQDNVTLRGSGCRATTLRFGTHSIRPSDKIYKYWHAVVRIIGKRDAHIADLRIDGNKCSRHDGDQSKYFKFFTGIAIRAKGMTEYSTAAGEPWHVENSQVMEDESRDCTISRCVVENCPSTGIIIEGARRITITECEAYNNGEFGLIAGSYTHFCHFYKCTARRNYHGALELLANSRHHLVEACTLSNIVLQNSGTSPTYNRIVHCIIGPNHAADPVIINGHSFATVEGCTLIVDSGAGVNVFCDGLPEDVVDQTPDELKKLVRGVRISNNVIVASPFLTRSLITRIGREVTGPPFNFTGNLRESLQDTFEALVKVGLPANAADPVDRVTGQPPAHIPLSAAELTSVGNKLATLSASGSWTWTTPVERMQKILECLEFERHDLPRFLAYSPLLPNNATTWETILNFLPNEFFNIPEVVESSLEVQYPWDIRVAADSCREPVKDRAAYNPTCGISMRYVIDSTVSGNRVVGVFNVGILLHLSRGISVTENSLIGSDQWCNPCSGLVTSAFFHGRSSGWHTANRPFGFGIFIFQTLGSSIAANSCRGFEYGIHEGTTWDPAEAALNPHDPSPKTGYNYVLDNRLEENYRPYATKQFTTKYRDF